MRRRTTKPRIDSWKCGHFSPVLVEEVEGGKRARCLMCEECGDVREGALVALHALRERARQRDEAQSA